MYMSAAVPPAPVAPPPKAKRVRGRAPVPTAAAPKAVTLGAYVPPAVARGRVIQPAKRVAITTRDRGPAGLGGKLRALPSQRVGTVPDVGAVRTIRRSNASLLGEYSQEGTYLGFSLGKIVKNIGNTVKKAVVDTGHAVGKVATSTVGQAVVGGALALTGVGLPAAAGIMAATKGVGNLIKPGGNLKGAVTGAAQGAVEGAVASEAGSLGRSLISKYTSSGSATGVAATQAAQASPAVAAVTGAGGMGASALTAAVLPAPPQIATNPAQDGQIPQIGQRAPAYPRAKRTKASGLYPAQLGSAKKVLAAGRKANDAAQSTASGIDKLSSKLDSVTQALAAAQSIGDQNGISSLSSLASSLQSQIANVQNVAGGVAQDVRAAGGAAEGAAAGAVAGAGGSGLSQFIANNKTLVYGGAGGVALLVLLAMTHKRAA
jgi:hypothetical protein